jgi:hypothetical protein
LRLAFFQLLLQIDKHILHLCLPFAGAAVGCAGIDELRWARLELAAQLFDLGVELAVGAAQLVDLAEGRAVCRRVGAELFDGPVGRFQVVLQQGHFLFQLLVLGAQAGDLGAVVAAFAAGWGGRRPCAIEPGQQIIYFAVFFLELFLGRDQEYAE